MKVMDPFFNKKITIWNKHTDGVWKNEIWIPTVIENVRLLVSKGNNIMKSGLDNADSARLHIMDGISIPEKEYMPFVEWRNISPDNKKKYFTLDSENDSFFVEGDVSTLDASGKDNFFDYVKRNYNNCFRITKVDRFEIIPHYEVWGS